MQNSFVDVDIVARKPHENQYSPAEGRQLEQQRSALRSSATRSQHPEDSAGNFSHDGCEKGFSKGETRSPEHCRCPQCGSENLKSGAGRKPGEESRHCKDCKQFLGYHMLPKLKRLRKQRKLTEALELLESQGIRGEQTQLFVLSAIGGEA